MNNRPNVPLVRLFGIIALAAVIVFTMAACRGDEDDSGNGGNNGGNNNGGSGGTFTLTGIPSQYNGKYAFLQGAAGFNEETDDFDFAVMGCQTFNMSTQTVTLVPISNGSVSLPMWTRSGQNFVRYSGNDTCDFVEVIITNNQTFDFNTFIAEVMFERVAFSNGGATRAWSQGQSSGQ
jgi:hypothetical protein